MVVTGGVIAVGEGVPILSNVRGAPPAPAFPIEICYWKADAWEVGD